ncbi:acyltransferase [Hellea sp.]|nr:acyltransferase [Hellea sp.]
MFQTVKIRDGHDNFFTPLRLVFAILVVVGHTFNVALRSLEAEPQIFFQYNYSFIAVNLFFIASGFLVTKSMLYRGDIPEYASARILRIYPALIGVLLFTMFVIGPLATSLPWAEYFTHKDFLKQPFAVLSFYQTDMFLPGIFQSNYEQLAGAPLWTLRYEFLAYIGTALIFSLGLMRKKWMVLAQFILPSIAWVAANWLGILDSLPATIQALLRFGMAYGLGAAIFAYRDRLSFHVLGIPVMVLLAVLTSKLYVFEIMMNLMLAYFVMWAAYVKAPKFNALQKLSDVSYGIYIYHWLVMQLVFMWFPSLSTLALLVITLPVTYWFATLSWHFIEKPMLTKKKSFSQYLRFGRKKSVYDAGAMLAD